MFKPAPLTSKHLVSAPRGLIAAAMTVALSVFSVNVSLRAADAGNRVINGTNVPTSQYPTVGEVGDSTDATFFGCTGTLISPTHVLTAGHCLTNTKGALTVGQTGGRFRLNGVVYNTVHIFVHPSWKGGNNGDAEGEFDAIVMELDKPVPNVTPSPLYRQVPTVGQLLTIVGYGEQGTGTKGSDGTIPASGTVNFGTTTLDIVTPTYLKWNFENKQPVESNTAPGDSGGPQFITVNGVLTVASITNGGSLDSAGYGDVSYNTRVDAIAAWIDQVSNGATSGNAGSGGSGGTGGVSIASAASASPSNPAAKVSVAFSVSGADANGDALTYAWDFGDGAQGTGANVNHAYAADGDYTATVTVTDGKGGSASSSVNVTVGNGGGNGGNGADIPVSAQKCKFKLNFRVSGRDTLDLTFSNAAFRYSDRQTFSSSVDGLAASVSIGDTSLDDLTFSRSGMGTGNGRLRWDSRNGLIRYQLRNADLADLLDGYGASNDDIDASVTVPLTLVIDGQTYTSSYTFSYRGKADISGQGK